MLPLCEGDKDEGGEREGTLRHKTSTLVVKEAWKEGGKERNMEEEREAGRHGRKGKRREEGGR